MSWYRGMIFGQAPESAKKPSGGKWIAILAIVVLLGVFWHYGIVTAIGDMLSDLATACEDFWQWVVNQARR